MIGRLGRALAPGLLGSLALTAMHEAGRRYSRTAPRMDVVGKRGLKRAYRAFGARAPHGRTLFNRALVSELAMNAAYYGLAARGKRRLLRGTLLGLAAGAAASAVTPKRYRFIPGAARVNRKRQLAAAGLYTAAGLVSGAAGRFLARRQPVAADLGP